MDSLTTLLFARPDQKVAAMPEHHHYRWYGISACSVFSALLVSQRLVASYFRCGIYGDASMAHFNRRKSYYYGFWAAKNGVLNIARWSLIMVAAGAIAGRAGWRLARPRCERVARTGTYVQDAPSWTNIPLARKIFPDFLPAGLPMPVAIYRIWEVVAGGKGDQ
jgi:hypothetical protein